MKQVAAFFRRKRNQLLFIGVLTVLAYINIFPNQFLLDDETFIVNWPQIRSIENLPDLLRGGVPVGHEGVYRPVRSVLYAIYYPILGTNPFGYHLHGVVVNVLSTLLVYLILEMILKKRNLAFVGSILFGLHPVHTESITYISASMEMTGAVFFLASFYLYLLRKTLPYFLSIFLALLAFFTYEMTLTLPLLIILYDLCFHPRGGKLKLAKFWQGAKVYVPYFVAAMVYLIARVGSIGLSGRGDYLGGSFYLTMLASFKAFWGYLIVSVAPLNLAHNHILPSGIEAILYRGHNLDQFLTQSIFDRDILLAVLSLSVLIIAAYKSFKSTPLVSFGIGWFFISLLPASNIIPQWTLMHEKFLYLPLFGLVMVPAGLAGQWLETQNYNLNLKTLRIVSMACLFIVLASFFYLTYQRNMDWKDAVTLWSKDVQTAPKENAYAYFQLGEALLGEGDEEKSI